MRKIVSVLAVSILIGTLLVGAVVGQEETSTEMNNATAKSDNIFFTFMFASKFVTVLINVGNQKSIAK